MPGPKSSKPAATPKAEPKSATYINNGRSGVSLSSAKKLQPGDTVELTSDEAKLFKGLLERV